ncbi:hypothetical protein [Pyxidicoccus trucidator]|uniref:hypothetical protein n=1 Tax=Pyxidicoccus trucidator TaxID=2709662 RepID=UPI0013D990B6|nr:hypothetical protein [Pyxidicoccus trucidator]
MLKACLHAVLVMLLSGCTAPSATWKGKVEWPDTGAARKNIVPFTEAGTALAAAAAVREMVKQNPYPDLFSGCASPEQGLDVAVFTGPTPGVYYVLVDQRFDRCGGPSVRVLDGWYEYAVTPQGEVIGKAPPPPAEDTLAPPPLPPGPPPQPDQTPPPTVEPSQPAATPPAPIPAPDAPPASDPAPAPPPPSPQEPGRAPHSPPT